MMKRWIWPFELQEKIGEGGMGVVYRARYVPRNRMLAVKMLSSEGVDGVFLARFERELEILKTLRHPNIVHCFGGVCEDKQRFYAMELVEGGTLDQLIRASGKLPWEQVVEYGQQMCAALACAHQQGVVHRDVKPGNFLITKDGRLKLSDFGLATVLAGRRITAADKTMGTYLYMAPEQIRGQEITPRTDLYALGCVLFEMVSGRPPFEGQTPAAILHRHLKEPPAKVSAYSPDCPPDLERLILELLSKDPAQRPESADAVAERLRNIDGNIVVTSARREGGVGNRLVGAATEPKVETVAAAAAAAAAAPPGRAPAADASPRRLRPAGVLAAGVLLFCGLLVWNLVLVSGDQHGDASIKEWVRATKNGSVEVRLVATDALGRIGASGEGVVEALEGRLEDRDPRVRKAAAAALRVMGADAGPAMPALTKLIRTDDDPGVRQQGEAALTAIRKGHSGGSSGGWLLLAAVVVLAGGAAFLWARRGGSNRAVESRNGRQLVRTGVPRHNGR
jgi:serine/threonine-protein kinase